MHVWQEDLHTTNYVIYLTHAVPMPPYVREMAVIAIFILLSCVTLVRNKTLLINEYVRDDTIDILAITETWLKWGGDSAFITELTPDSYNFIHAPRQRGRGGGVGLLHRETYSCKLLASPCFKHMELLRARLMSPAERSLKNTPQSWTRWDEGLDHVRGTPTMWKS